MGVEFTLGHNDHIKAEDFLASRPAGVGVVTLHPTAAKHQLGVAEAARDAGMDVLFEPRTEYLAYPDPGEATRKLPGWTGEVLDISRLTRNQVGTYERFADSQLALCHQRLGDGFPTTADTWESISPLDGEDADVRQ